MGLPQTAPELLYPVEGPVIYLYRKTKIAKVRLSKTLEEAVRPGRQIT